MERGAGDDVGGLAEGGAALEGGAGRVEVIKGPIDVKVIEEEIKKPPPPPEVVPPPPKLEAPPPPYIPPPEVQIATPPPAAGASASGCG